MRFDVILTTLEGGQLTEKRVGAVAVTRKTDLDTLFSGLAARYFHRVQWTVRRDSTIFGRIAVDSDGNCIEVR